MRSYLLKVKFGELSLINMALKTLMKRMMAKLVSMQITPLQANNKVRYNQVHVHYCEGWFTFLECKK